VSGARRAATLLATSRLRGLLVSVRDAREAAAAIEGGADIIDVKEPRAGSLGRPTPDACLAVAAAAEGCLPWTMACGELREGPRAIIDHITAVGRLLGDCPGPAAIKVGLAGMAGRDWRTDLAAVYGSLECLPAGVGPVAVIYADAPETPPAEEILAAAGPLGCRAVLVDTFDKSAGSTLDCRTPAELSRWRAAATAAGMAFVLAGRLSAEDLAAAAEIAADVIAVRSAVCSGGRNGTVEAAKVRTLASWRDSHEDDRGSASL